MTTTNARDHVTRAPAAGSAHLLRPRRRSGADATRATGGARPLRILQVAPPWFPVPPPRYGGTEQVVGHLAAELVARGHDVTVLTTGDATVAGTRWSAFDRAPTEHIGDPSFELVHLMAAYGRDLEFDVIHDHTLVGASIATLAAPSTPVIHTLHGRWTEGGTLVCRALGRRCDLVAISHDQAARAPEGIDISRVVHNGIDISRFPFDGGRTGHLAFLGRSSPEKAPNLAVEVARRLGRRLVMGVKINEPAEKAYWRDVVEPTIGDHDVEVVRNADHAQKVDILTGASALVFPIQWPEPFGLVPVEANACGTPVVAFANGAVPEVVAHGRSGMVVDPRRGVDGLVAAVDAAERLDRRKCRAHAATAFSAARMVDDYESAYRRAIGSRSGHESRRNARMGSGAA